MGESLTTHTTPPAALAQSEQAAKPPLRASRFDQRGIALQTVIIMVVLLAIAGGVSAVLLTRGSQATSQLEATSDITAANLLTITNETLCKSSGGKFKDTKWTVKEADVDIDLSDPLDGDKTDTMTTAYKCVPQAWTAS